MLALLTLSLVIAVAGGLLVFWLAARAFLGEQATNRRILRTWTLLLLLGLVCSPLSFAFGKTGVVVFVAFVQFSVALLIVQNSFRFTLGRAFGFLVTISVLGSVVGGMVAFPVRAYLVQAFRMPTASMEPTFKTGDYFLVEKLSARRGDVRRGDCVVFPFPRDPSQDYFKRVVAVEGDTLHYRAKKLFINGDLQAEPYVIHVDGSQIKQERDHHGPLVVPEGEVFVLGDSRDRTSDSRYFGTIDAASIKGRAWFIYAPLSRIGMVDRPAGE